MIACLQRVARASVVVSGEVVGRIERGGLVLLGIANGDTDRDAVRLAERVAGYRYFPNAGGSKSIDKSVLDLGLGLLVVSQFTLCADTRKGMRPGFEPAAAPDSAEPLYELFVAELRRHGVARVETGRFGAHMSIELLADGPVTLLVATR